MEENFNFFHILHIIAARIRPIAVASLVVGIVTACITLFLPNYYEASTTFYAASPDLASPTPLSTSQNRINIYGNDEDLDRLLSISASQRLFEFMIDSFGLYAHYKISPDDTKGPYKVKRKLLRHMDVSKTKYGAILLTVEDKDPVFASTLTNGARNQIDRIAQDLIKKSQIKTIESYTLNIREKTRSLQSLIDTIALLREKYGIIDANSQGEVMAQLSAETSFSLSEAYAALNTMKELNMPVDTINKTRAKVAGLSSKKSDIEKQLKQFNEGISIIKTLENQMVLTNDQVSLMNERLKQLESAYLSPFNALHVVEESIPPVVKSRPQRSLITIASIFLTFILASLGILLRESIRNTQWS